LALSNNAAPRAGKEVEAMTAHHVVLAGRPTEANPETAVRLATEIPVP
jgi:hypothetical protein